MPTLGSISVTNLDLLMMSGQWKDMKYLCHEEKCIEQKEVRAEANQILLMKKLKMKKTL